MLVVSMDLPFGQKRWCGAEGVANVKALSAHRCGQFGENYGTLIKGGVLDRLTTRAVFVVDAAGKLTHVEYCAEVRASELRSSFGGSEGLVLRRLTNDKTTPEVLTGTSGEFVCGCDFAANMLDGARVMPSLRVA